jgi:ABC-type multidrug transport system fused ATPase/permease subunit
MFPLAVGGAIFSVMPDLTLIILVSLTVALAAVFVDRRLRRSRRRVATVPVADSAEVERAFVDQFATEPTIDRVTRQRDEYFHVIERIEQERNQWVEMWRIQAAEHQTAQAILGQQLGQTRQVAARAINMLNELRKKHDLEPIAGPDNLLPYDGEPVFEAQKYAYRMMSLRDELGAPIDALADRSAIEVEFRSEPGDEDENP